MVPIYIMVDIKETDVKGVFVWNSTDLGNVSGINQVYFIAGFICESCLPIMISIILATITRHK